MPKFLKFYVNSGLEICLELNAKADLNKHGVTAGRTIMKHLTNMLSVV